MFLNPLKFVKKALLNKNKKGNLSVSYLPSTKLVGVSTFLLV